MGRYRVVQLSTGRVHIDTDVQEQASEAFAALEASGVDFDDLDILDTERGVSLVVRAHESAVRSMLADAREEPYVAFRTLAEARAAPVAAIILESDYGGQISATCPAGLVTCSEERLSELSIELAVLTDENERGAGLVYEPLGTGARVSGGQGGGLVTDGLWVHEAVRQLGLRDAIEAVLTNRTDVLAPTDPDVPADVRAAILRAYHERVDVFCFTFGFEPPAYLLSMHHDERQRKQDAAVPPPRHYTRWYSSTLRAVVRQAGFTIEWR